MYEGVNSYGQLTQLFYDCYGCLKTPMQGHSKIPKIMADYVWDPDRNRRSREHVLGSLNEVFFGTVIAILLETDALRGEELDLRLEASGIHDDACGVDYFLSLPTGELIGGLDVKCSPTRRVKTPNSTSATRSFNTKSLEGEFYIVEVGATPYELHIFDYMQLLRDLMVGGYDLSPVTPENYLREELSNGRLKAALGGIKGTLGYYIDDYNLPFSFRNGLGALDDATNWHIGNTGSIDYGGLY